MVNIKLVILVSVLVSLLLPIVMAQTYSNNINSNNIISSDAETKNTDTDTKTNTQNTDVKEDINRINRWLRTGIKITYINEGREINFVNTTPNRTINRTPPIPPRNVTPNRTINRTPPIPPRNVTPNRTINRTSPIPPRNVTPNGTNTTNTTFTCTNGTHPWYIATTLANGTIVSSTGAIIPPSRIVTPSTRVCGDVNGDGRVTIADALRLRQILVTRAYFAPGICPDCSNVDGVGSLTSSDVRRIALMALGLARGNCPPSCR